MTNDNCLVFVGGGDGGHDENRDDRSYIYQIYWEIFLVRNFIL